MKHREGVTPWEPGDLEAAAEGYRRKRRAASTFVGGWRGLYAGLGVTGWVAQATPPLNDDQFGSGSEGEGAEGGEGAGEGGGGEQ